MHVSVDPISQLYGDKVTVTADVMGPSVASYQWLQDDNIMELSTAACDGLGTNKLTISFFTRDYEGMYQCAVSFSDGEVAKSMHIELSLSKFIISTQGIMHVIKHYHNTSTIMLTNNIICNLPSWYTILCKQSLAIMCMHVCVVVST